MTIQECAAALAPIYAAEGWQWGLVFEPTTMHVPGEAEIVGNIKYLMESLSLPVIHHCDDECDECCAMDGKDDGLPIECGSGGIYVRPLDKAFAVRMESKFHGIAEYEVCI